jgi:beta-lactamase regulating signal transducer with metallopeptidase domain
MNPDLLLSVVTALASFLLKTTLAFGVCLAMSWLVDSPGRRFVVWSSFLYATAAYWLWLARGVFVSGHPAASTSPALAQAASSTISIVQIPASWAFPLGVALRLIGIVYALVLVFMLVTHIKKHRQLKWILGFTTQPPTEIAEAFQPLANKFHVGRSRLLVLSGATSQATFGWIRPTIVLPDVCLKQDRSELEDILRHELHHIRRWDFVWNGFAVACRALIFFHPAAWYAVRKMQFDRELACDLAAVSDSPTGRAKYAECLIHFARLNSAQDSRNWGIDFAASSGHLKARIHSILAGSTRPSAWLAWSRIACGLALFAGFLVIEPSLGVLLSYAQQQISQPLTQEIRATPTKMAIGAKAIRKVRLSTASVATGVNTPSQEDATQPSDLSAPRAPEDSASAPSGGGPHLLHRGTPVSGNVAQQQTVLLTDSDASGQVSKSGDRAPKQALQQSATVAAGLYKQLSGLDRR